jgi:ParB/RepB/Spo0J family partition protein
MTPPASATDAPVVSTLALDQLDPKHWPNPRGDVDTASDAFAELSASIAAQGILEPIGVGAELDDGRYPVIFGWRRYTAALVAGVAEVPVRAHPQIADAKAALLAALAENMAREDMTPLAEASAIAKLVELGLTQVDAAAAVGVSERTARERLRLLDLPERIRKLVDAGDVPTTCTRQLQLVADASPEVAVSIAKRVKNGTVKAFQLLDAPQLYHVLELLSRDPQIPIVLLRYSIDPKILGLSPATTKELAARSKKANADEGNSYSGDRLNLHDVPAKLLGEAKAAGKVLDVEHGLFVVGEWVEKVAINAIERTERRAAKRKREREKLKAGKTADSAVDPREHAKAERDALEQALTERCRPHAVEMNAEIGARLRTLTTCNLTDPVGDLIIRLAMDHRGGSQRVGTWAHALPVVDPGRKLQDFATLATEQAAAEIVCAIVAAACSDGRATGNDHDAGCGDWAMAGLYDAAVDVALALQLLPVRAVRLVTARKRMWHELRGYRLRGARRRILVELAAETAGLGAADLCVRSRAYRLDLPAGIVDVDPHIPSHLDRFDDALAQLLELGEVAGVERDGDLHYTITAAGTAALATTPGPEPRLEDIDGIGIELQLVDEEPPESDELVVKLPRPEQSVPSKQRRGRILELLAEHPGITIPELAEAMAIKQNWFYRFLPALVDEGLVRKDGRGWHLVAVGPAADVVIVHVTPTHGGGEPVEAELQPDPGATNARKVIYTASRTAAWVAASRIVDLPAESAAA